MLNFLLLNFLLVFLTHKKEVGDDEQLNVIFKTPNWCADIYALVLLKCLQTSTGPLIVKIE
jgi:hypothetical protein